jgi:hypothetical protein
MRSEGTHLAPGLAEPSVELGGEEEVGQLALAVPKPGGVALVTIDVVEADAADLVHRTRDGHDPPGRAGLQRRHEPEREREMPEVVGGQLHLEPVGRSRVGNRHDPGVVHQQVERTALPQPTRHELAHAGELREVQGLDRNPGLRDGAPDVGHRARGLLGVARRDDDLGTRARELAGRFEAEAAVSAGDDGHAAGLGGDVGDPPGHQLPSSSSLRRRPLRSSLSPP